jgi:hypothetical protein
MLTFRQQSLDKYGEFLARRKTGWFDAPHQRIHRSIECLMAIFNTVLQCNLPAGHHTASSRTITPHHIDLFRRGVEANAHVPKLTVHRHGDDIAQCLQRVSYHLLSALSHVPAFASFDQAQLQKLRDAMHAAKYEDRELVVEQGTAGEHFFMVTAGRAEARSSHPVL